MNTAVTEKMALLPQQNGFLIKSRQTRAVVVTISILIQQYDITTITIVTVTSDIALLCPCA